MNALQNGFASLDEVAERLLAFQRRYEELAPPFEWKFTRDDLASLMARLSLTDRDALEAA